MTDDGPEIEKKREIYLPSNSKNHLCENGQQVVILIIHKPEVHNVSQRRRRGDRATAARNMYKNVVKFGGVERN